MRGWAPRLCQSEGAPQEVQPQGERWEVAPLGGGRVSQAPMGPGPLLAEFTDKEMHSTVSTSR